MSKLRGAPISAEEKLASAQKIAEKYNMPMDDPAKIDKMMFDILGTLTAWAAALSGDQMLA